jgi:hypothetical protein
MADEALEEKMLGCVLLGKAAAATAQAVYDAFQEEGREVSVGLVLAADGHGCNCVVGDRPEVLRGMLLGVLRDLELGDLIEAVCSAHGLTPAELARTLTARAEA